MAEALNDTEKAMGGLRDGIPSPLSVRQVLRIVSFRRLWVAETVSTFGDFLTAFAVISLVSFRLNGNGTQISEIIISYWLPFAIVGPFSGELADRLNLKCLLVISDLIRAVVVFALINAHGMPRICGTFAVLGIASAIFSSAQAVMIRRITPVRGLIAANALMAQAIQTTQIICPAIAGLLVHWVGMNYCFVLDGFSYISSLSIISRIKLPEPLATNEKPSAFGLASMKESFSLMLHNRLMSFILVSLTAGLFAVNCFGALLSIYVRDVLRMGTVAFGTLDSLIGAGLLVASQMLPIFARKVPMKRLVSYGLAGMGFAVLTIALITRVSICFLAMFGIGFFAALVSVPAETMLQCEVPPQLLGRVSASITSLLIFSQMGGMLLAGRMTQSTGIRLVYYASALVLLLTAIFGYLYTYKVNAEPKR